MANQISDVLVDGENVNKSALRTYFQRRESVVNVKDFGAIGDGATDDQAAIAAAITAAGDGGTVFFPTATYALEDGISIDGVTLDLNNSVLDFSALDASTDGITVAFNQYAISGATHPPRIKTGQLLFDDGGRDAIRVRGSDHPILEDLFISKPGRDGVRFEPGANSEWLENYTLRNVFVSGAGAYGYHWVQDGTYTDSFMTEGVLINCEARSCASGLVRFDNGADASTKKISSIVFLNGEFGSGGAGASDDYDGFFFNNTGSENIEFIHIIGTTIEVTGTSPATGYAIGTNDATKILRCTFDRPLLTGYPDGDVESEAAYPEIVFIDKSSIKSAIPIIVSDGASGGARNADALVFIDTSGSGYLQITSGTSGQASILLGDSDDIDIGAIHYNNSSNSMVFRINAQTAATLGSDLSLILAGILRRKVTDGITAGSTQTQGGATQLVSDFNRVSTCATAGDGVKLPTAVAGAECWVRNDGAENMQIWPNTSDAIDGGSANAVDGNVLAAGASRRYIAMDATNWYTA